MANHPFTTASTETWRNYNILIVDDEPGILHTVESDLFLEGLKPFKASSGEEALELMKQRDIHVILSDQKMPGMSGTQLIARARERNPKTVGIILSAFSEAEFVLSAINDAGVFRYLLKPWESRKLVESVTDALKFYELQANSYGQREELGYTRSLFTESVNQAAQLDGDRTQLLTSKKEDIHMLTAMADILMQKVARDRNLVADIEKREKRAPQPNFVESSKSIN